MCHGNHLTVYIHVNFAAGKVKNRTAEGGLYLPQRSGSSTSIFGDVSLYSQNLLTAGLRLLCVSLFSELADSLTETSMCLFIFRTC